jgi:hypothetical protein
VLAAAKALGLRRSVLATCLLGALTLLCSPNAALGIPTIAAPVEVLQMVPVLAGLTVPMGLVDTRDDRLATSARSLERLFAGRLLVVAACTGLEALLLHLVGPPRAAGVTVALVALASVGTVLGRGGYWIPVVVVGYGWLQLCTGPHAAWFSPLAAGASAVVASAIYVVGSAIRVRAS